MNKFKRIDECLLTDKTTEYEIDGRYFESHFNNYDFQFMGTELIQRKFYETKIEIYELLKKDSIIKLIKESTILY